MRSVILEIKDRFDIGRIWRILYLATAITCLLSRATLPRATLPLATLPHATLPRATLPLATLPLSDTACRITACSSAFAALLRYRLRRILQRTSQGDSSTYVAKETLRRTSLPIRAWLCTPLNSSRAASSAVHEASAAYPAEMMWRDHNYLLRPWQNLPRKSQPVRQPPFLLFRFFVQPANSHLNAHHSLRHLNRPLLHWRLPPDSRESIDFRRFGIRRKDVTVGYDEAVDEMYCHRSWHRWTYYSVAFSVKACVHASRLTWVNLLIVEEGAEVMYGCVRHNLPLVVMANTCRCYEVARAVAYHRNSDLDGLIFKRFETIQRAMSAMQHEIIRIFNVELPSGVQNKQSYVSFAYQRCRRSCIWMNNTRSMSAVRCILREQ